MMVETFAALAEPNRFRIVELLRGGPQPVGAIVERLALAQPQVSKHLKVLKDVGLVDVEARAQQRHYELRGAPLRELFDWLEDYRRLWDERMNGIDAVLDDLKAREAQKQRTQTQAQAQTKTKKAAQKTQRPQTQKTPKQQTQKGRTR